jgi:hypothetical protein
LLVTAASLFELLLHYLVPLLDLPPPEDEVHHSPVKERLLATAYLISWHGQEDEERAMSKVSRKRPSYHPWKPFLSKTLLPLSMNKATETV